jgi:hypothetical protein
MPKEIGSILANSPYLFWSPQSESNYDLILTMDAMLRKKLRPAASSCAFCGAHLSHKFRSSRLAFLALLAFSFACSEQSASMVRLGGTVQFRSKDAKRDREYSCEFSLSLLEPSIRIELMTSSLPWMRSAY